MALHRLSTPSAAGTSTSYYQSTQRDIHTENTERVTHTDKDTDPPPTRHTDACTHRAHAHTQHTYIHIHTHIYIYIYINIA